METESLAADSTPELLPFVQPPAAETSEHLPPLISDRGFWSMAVTQFLGAFNDNLFKQLVLLLATPRLVEGVAQGQDRQGMVMAVFAAPFILLAGLSGWLADRLPKRNIIIGAKMAEIFIMLLGMIAFLQYDPADSHRLVWGLMIVLCLMGIHSTFFGPPKYGILPEMLRDSDLPKANGIFLMLTFLAIICGTALAVPFEKDLQNAWLGSLMCMGIAVVGTFTAFGVRHTPAANPTAPLRPADLITPPETLAIVRADRQLMLALLVTSLFWLLGGIVTSGVNALGKTQLGLSGNKLLLFTTMVAVGIPVGCLLGGYLSRGRINPRIVRAGGLGILTCLVLLCLRGGPQQHLLGFTGSLPVLVLLGLSTGMFVVPIQVSLQVLPPKQEKGRIIALMNLCNWIGIIVGAILLQITMGIVEANNSPRNTVFALGAAIMLPVVLFYRPKEVVLSEKT
jgi:acyl-[acyl-carrier-protein]-phospholipid O-acyltransferase/long-chain-fatty-acid--[acyl-carrier-protein] ligase